MKRSIALVSIGLALLVATSAAADPGGPNVQQNVILTCSNGTTVVVNGGTVPNQSHQVFVVDSTSILVANYLSATADGTTIVLFDSAPGREPSVTCTGLFGPYVIEIRGVFTPRSRAG